MADFNWDFPYASRRMPVLAENVVATSQPLAAQAGLQMLYKGGNAVDAALAAAIIVVCALPSCIPSPSRNKLLILLPCLKFTMVAPFAPPVTL